MNSYPTELIVQHAPVMFVAGLTESEGASTPTGPSDPSSPTVDTKDPFGVLIGRLRLALSAKRRTNIWDSDRARRFQTVLVDKAVRFPPRKIIPHQNTRIDDSLTASVPRSPLSPLIPSSPLYPDGLIAPIWVRKHLELVPSVFVLFLRLWEPPPLSSPLDTGNSQDKDEERKQDTDLSAEISVRKRSTGERGIKLTVVLLASRRMLEDPSLDSRLSLIRRQSGLDSRAALFVLSPLSSAELQEFIQSLQDALFESATDYYTAHTKRVRRKKSRVPPQSPPIPAGSGPTIGRPLRNEGWLVRYEYKMATFAEFRMEDELARKHYEDCWEGLLNMFMTTTVLPPRTKRWAEAKVLADTVSLKICKLYLYHSEFGRALTHFNRHLMRLTEMSISWGIGKDTFEYWSWVARQYRAFAELLEQASRSGLQLPIGSVSQMPGMSPSNLSALAISNAEQPPVIIGLNPLNSLQHAGYFYYTAATSTRHRLERFIATNNQQNSAVSSALVNERKVDHLGTLTELYTKGYELFKLHGGSSRRLTYHMAYRIAEIHFLSKRYDLAARFFERIVGIHEEERWDYMPEPLLTMWCECSRKLGDKELTIRLLLAILLDTRRSIAERSSAEEELREILEAPTNPDSQPNSIDIERPLSLFSVSTVFWQKTVYIGEPASFQLTLIPSEATAKLPFAELRIYYSEHLPPVIVQHPQISSESSYTSLGCFDVSSIDGTSAVPIQADLRWAPGKPKTFAGHFTSSVITEFCILKLELVLETAAWNITMPVELIRAIDETPRTVQWYTPSSPTISQLSVTRMHPDTCSVLFRPHLLSISFIHEEPAYCNELYPIIIEITNEDHQDLEFDMDVLLQPSDDDTVSYIMVSEERSKALIKGVSFGVVQKGDSAVRTLYFIGGASGEKMLDMSIQSRASPAQPEPDQIISTNETLRQLRIPVVSPMQYSSRTTYLQDPHPLPPLVDLSKFEPNAFEPAGRALVSVDISCSGPLDIVVNCIQFIPQVSLRARVLYSSLDFGEGDFPSTWRFGDVFSIICEIQLGKDDTEEFPVDEIPFPGLIKVTWQKVNSSAHELAETDITLPNLKPPEDGLVTLLTCPPSVKLHEPFTLTLSIQNRQHFRTADPYLDVDSSEAFVLAGPRHIRLPTLLPGVSEDISYNLIPLSTGEIPLPTFKVHDRRKPPGLLPENDEGEETGVARERAAATRVPVLLVSKDVRLDEPVHAEGRQREQLEAHLITVYPY